METGESLKLNSYFLSLPNEILLKILRYLSTFDVIQFCESYPEYEYFLEEKQLLKVINLSKKSGFKRVPYLSNVVRKFRAECISVFNITNIYWVPAVDIRKCLKKLRNLEELYILGTKVGISSSDCESYNSVKLKKLSVTIEDKDLETSKANNFQNVRSLCVQIVSKKDYTFQYRLQCVIKSLKSLEELWVQDLTESFPLDYDHLAYTASNLKIFAFKAVCSVFTGLKFGGLTKVIFNERTGREAYYEKIDHKVIEPRTLAENSAWKLLNELHADNPYGIRDARKLFHQTTNINEISFEELNFKHLMHKCCPRYLVAIREIISSKNARNLKKLTLTNCLFIDDSIELAGDNPKKRKINYLSEHETEEHKVLINNLQTLKELEIYVCLRYEGIKIYYFIQYFKNLTQLSLEIPGSVNGEFLKLVLENCDLLESLKITLVVSNESFNRDFTRFISLAKNLKTLRYEHYRVSLENFFLGLSEIKTPKMERLFLKCKTVDNFGYVNLKKFLQNNPSLDFFVIVIESATAKMLRMLSDQMKVFEDTSEKAFVVAKCSEKCFTNPFRIPELYKSDLMSVESCVANLDFAEDFYCSS